MAENPRILECTVCGRSFTQWSNLKRHTLSAHNIVLEGLAKKPKVHECDVCYKSFTEWKSLKRHMITAHEIMADELSKQKIRDVESWKRNVQKRRRTEGKAYIKSSKQGEVIVPEKEFVCITHCCVKNCYKAISKDQQRELFDNFYTLGNKSKQDYYLSRYISSEEIKRRTTSQKSTFTRNNMWKYSVAVTWKGKNCRVVVCRNLFLMLFQVGTKRVQTIVTKMSKGIDLKDRRGLHFNRVNRIPASVWVLVDEHLTGLAAKPPMEGAENQSESFHTKTLFDLFQEYFQERTKSNLKMKYSTYRNYLKDHYFLKQHMASEENDKVREEQPYFSSDLEDVMENSAIDTCTEPLVELAELIQQEQILEGSQEKTQSEEVHSLEMEAKVRGTQKCSEVKLSESKVNKRRTMKLEGMSDVKNSNQDEGLGDSNQSACVTKCCAKNCYNAISLEHQVEMFKHFKGLTSKGEQDLYLSRFFVNKEIKSRSVKTVRKNRNKRWEISMIIGMASKRVAVCKQFFTQLFNVTEVRLTSIKLKLLKGRVDFSDRRAYNRPNRIPNSTNDQNVHKIEDSACILKPARVASRLPVKESFIERLEHVAELNDPEYIPEDSSESEDSSEDVEGSEMKSVTEPKRESRTSQRNMRMKIATENPSVVNNFNQDTGSQSPSQSITHCCVKSCYKTLSNVQQLEITRHFQSLNSRAQQYCYLSRLVVNKEIKSRRVKTVRENRINRWEYHVAIAGADDTVTVCKELFLKLFQISEKGLRTLQRKITGGCDDFSDKRGCHKNRPKRIPAEVWSCLNEHLESLKTELESQYTTDNTLASHKPTITIKKMFFLFQKYYKEKTRLILKMKYNTYWSYVHENHRLEPFMPHLQKREDIKPEIDNSQDSAFILVVSDEPG